MYYQIPLKRTVKKTVSHLTVVTNFFNLSRSEQNGCIFYYHRVSKPGFSDYEIDDRNVLPEVFEQQIAALSEFAEVVPLAELTERLARQTTAGQTKPLISLTFDDGYANFKTHALPVLERYRMPAVLFVVTGYIGDKNPAPFDLWGLKNHRKVEPDIWRMLNRGELDDCIKSGLITLGAHSHRHLKAYQCTTEQIQEEAFLSAEILHKTYGAKHARLFSYPYGNSMLGHVPDTYKNAVRAAGFKLAVTTDVGHPRPETNPLLLPRLEVYPTDSPAALEAKATGAIAPLYLYEKFQKLRYRWRNEQEPSSDVQPAGGKQKISFSK